MNWEFKVLRLLRPVTCNAYTSYVVPTKIVAHSWPRLSCHFSLTSLYMFRDSGLWHLAVMLNVSTKASERHLASNFIVDVCSSETSVPTYEITTLCRNSEDRRMNLLPSWNFKSDKYLYVVRSKQTVLS
jgi:hypothetical protein